MKNFEHNFHKNVNVISFNKCNERNFFCPKTLEDDFNVYKGGKRYFNLNGEYDFCYFKKGEQFTPGAKFSKVVVPSCWQCFGHGNVCYVNHTYLIDINPPFVDDSDYGVYKRSFDINKKENKRYYINFEGKDSCLYLYINNRFVGFDSVSHCTSEFDITDYIVDGNNEMLVFVYVYCVGTYFECQDKFRLSGLFRDVYILERESKHVESYAINYVKNNNDIDVTISFKDPEIEKRIQIFDQDNCIADIVTSDSISTFSVKNAELWNAENPYLYRLKIIANNEVIYDYLGFRFVELVNNVFKLNGKPIKITGTNHHDSKYETGYYLTLEDYRRDLVIMKECHMNGIRTSHYPPAPEFLYMCDEFGFYVIDEADIECHGAVHINNEVYNVDTMDAITDNVVFDEVIGDRINRLVTRDFNRPSILFWSGGNESGYGQVLIKYLKLLKQRDPSRIVHYESTYTKSPDRNNYVLDIESKMYPSLDDIRNFLNTDTRPLILCEYSHAMGNSNGDTKDYVELFYSEPRIIGGFIWEFNDHLFPINLDKNKPGYGGDFGETIHDGNFCVDGLVSYKREISSNLKEVKSAYSKLIVYKSNNTFYLNSRFDFININDIRISVTKNLNKYRDFVIKSIHPGETLELLKDDDYENLSFEIYVKDKKYHAVSFVNKEQKITEITNASEFGVVETLLNLKNDKINISFNKSNGLISDIVFNGKILVLGSCLQFMRAPIDNDRYEIDSWQKDGLFNNDTVANKYSFNGEALIFDIDCGNKGSGQLIYKLNNNKISIEVSFDVNKGISYLPRFGYCLYINKDYRNYNYIGYGPDESYCDKKNLAMYGKYEDKISKDIFYVKPQEYGSHLGSLIQIKNENNSFSVSGMNSFSYLPFSVEELSNKKHSYELVEEVKYNYLSLDYMMTGVGSHACGPETDPKYKLIDKNIKMKLLLEIKED